MYKNVLVSIDGVNIFPIISLIIFFVFFVGLIIWVVRIDKNYVKEMEILPLDTEDNTAINFTGEKYEK